MRYVKLSLVLVFILSLVISCSSREAKNLKEEIKLLKEENAFLKAENVGLKKEIEELYKKLEGHGGTKGPEQNRHPTK